MTGLVIDHIPFDLEAEIVAVRNAKVEQERREVDAMREAAFAASREVYRRAEREKALARGVRFFSLAFVLMMGVAAVAEMRMGGVL